jgi:methionyl-tRNA formyltransferase
MKKLKIILIGCNPLTRKGLEAISGLDCCYLCGLITLPVAGASGKANYDPMPEFVAAYPDAVLFTKDVNSRETHEWIKERGPDIMLQLGWSQIFSEETLALPSVFCLGIHPAPLPEGRGAAVINWKIIEGGGAWGNSLFVMQPKTDTGDILDFEPFVIEPRDDAGAAFCKVDRTAVKMLLRTIPKIADGTFTARQQDGSKATRYRKRKPEDGRLEFDWDAEKLGRYVRALTHPYPGAFFESGAARMFIWNAVPNEAVESTRAPGEVIEIIRGYGVSVQCGSGTSLLIKRITPPSDFECWADEWALENALKPGQSLFQ